MKWILYLLAVIWISSGCFMILYTDEYRQKMKQFLEKVGRVVAASIALGAGILLVIAAFYSSSTTFVVILGLLAIAKGGIFLVNPGNAYEKMVNLYLNESSDQTYRFYGIIALVLGTALISWA